MTIDELYARLPGIEAENAALKGKPIAKMRAKHGAGPDGATCGTCQHFRRSRYHDQRYFKCALYGQTRSSASDWRMKWPACGQFRRQEG